MKKTNLTFGVMGVALFVTVCSLILFVRRGDRVPRELLDARGQIQSVITNSVIGYYRTVEINVRDFDPNPKLWTAEATVEHYNQAGGVEREKIFFECLTTNVWTVNVAKQFSLDSPE